MGTSEENWHYTESESQAQGQETSAERDREKVLIRFDVLSLFPEIFSGYVGQSILSKAIDRGLIEVHLWNIRDWADGKHKSVDDRPYGGGSGMVLRCEPVFACVEAVQAKAEPGRLVMLTPQGRRLDQRLAEQLVSETRLLLLCGRYEGFDERIRIGLQPTEISIGDYVTSGGEVPAMVIIDAVARLVPGVIGDVESHRDDSFGESGLIEYPHYTRPREFRGMRVPDTLLKGNHQEIARWRRRQAELRTRQARRTGIEPGLPPNKNETTSLKGTNSDQ
jgi:tRNA (guanine37-N1)-methyltransferase